MVRQLGIGAATDRERTLATPGGVPDVTAPRRKHRMQDPATLEALAQAGRAVLFSNELSANLCDDSALQCKRNWRWSRFQ